MPKIEKYELLNFGDPKIQLWKGVLFLYKFFTKSVISGSKCPKSENPKHCSCLLLCPRAQPACACLCWAVPAGHLCSVPQIQFLEGVIFLYKCFTKSVISGSKHPKSENFKICSRLLVLACAQPVLASEPMRLDGVEKRSARNKLRP